MLQEWWNDIVRWFVSPTGRTIFTSAILPVLAILVAAILAALIARGSIKRLIAQQDREQKASAIATLIASGRRAATWGTLSAAEKDHVDHQISEAEVRVRLLPAAGASLAADWAAHQLATMKTNSVNYSFQAEQDLSDLEDGLIAWHAKPSRARKLFAQDLAAWKYESSAAPVDDLATKQQAWNVQQAAAKEPATTVLPTA
jgi:hypothetical protein